MQFPFSTNRTFSFRRIMPALFFLSWFICQILGFSVSAFLSDDYDFTGYTAKIHNGILISQIILLCLPVAIVICAYMLNSPVVLFVYSCLKATVSGLCFGFLVRLFGASSWLIYLRFFFIFGFSSLIFLWLGFRFLKGFTFHVGFYSRIRKLPEQGKTCIR